MQVLPHWFFPLIPFGVISRCFHSLFLQPSTATCLLLPLLLLWYYRLLPYSLSHLLLWDIFLLTLYSFPHCRSLSSLLSSSLSPPHPYLIELRISPLYPAAHVSGCDSSTFIASVTSHLLCLCPLCPCTQTHTHIT